MSVYTNNEEWAAYMYLLTLPSTVEQAREHAMLHYVDRNLWFEDRNVPVPSLLERAWDAENLDPDITEGDPE